MHQIQCSRIRYGINCGVICFVIGTVLIIGLGDELGMLIVLLYNVLIYRLVRKSHDDGFRISFIGVGSVLLTATIFIVQYKFRRYIDSGCMKMLDDQYASNSYLLTTVLFSMLSWEAGLSILRPKLRI